MFVRSSFGAMLSALLIASLPMAHTVTLEKESSQPALGISGLNLPKSTDVFPKIVDFHEGSQDHHSHHLRHVRRAATLRARNSSKKCKSRSSESSSSDSANQASGSTNNDLSSSSKVLSKSSNGGSSSGSNGTSSSSSSSGNGNVTSTAGSGNFQRVQQNRGSEFWSGNNWDFFTYSDPTHGSVSFQSESAAKSANLIGLQDGAAFMRTSTANLSPGQNRPSVRFTSKQSYDSGLIIFDVVKMPVGCATWPALWTTGPNWPSSGEIDVVEGTGYTSSGKNANQMTVHLASNSPLQLNRREERKKRGLVSSLGKLVTGASNCNQYGATTGCAFLDSNSNGPSWGDAFNSAGGGVWAMQFGNDNGIKVWFWGRQSGKIPSELSTASSSPEKLDPSSWGSPMANFQTSLINSAVRNQNIVMDITIGGDWAGNVPMDGKCAGQSRSAAYAKGSNYQDAEFILNGIDVYCENAAFGLLSTRGWISQPPKSK